MTIAVPIGGADIVAGSDCNAEVQHLRAILLSGSRCFRDSLLPSLGRFCIRRRYTANN